MPEAESPHSRPRTEDHQPCSSIPAPLREHRPLWSAAALLLFALALASPFQEVWSEDLSVVVPMFPRFEGEESKQRNFWKWIGETEQRFVAWQVSRNARVLLEQPLELFETGQCHPTRKMMALGEPMIALGVLGVPFSLLSDEPLRVYNWVLMTAIGLAALSMYLLVKDWTGVPAAGIVAGLLYAFHSDHIQDINHYYIHDTAWTVFALFFARRLFASGRWNDAIGLALCVSMQMAGSFYPLVGAALLALPLGAWLIGRYGVDKIAITQWIAIGLILATTAFFIYAPYLEMRSDSVLATRTDLHFAAFRELLPGGGRFPGWLALVLAAWAIYEGGRKRSLFDPRLALLCGIVLVALMTIGGSSAKEMPPFYALLASLIPGLDAVRRPNELLSAMHICITLLAGLGTASLLQRVPRNAALASALLLVAASYTTTLRPAWLGFDTPVVYRAMAIRPAAEKIRFFEELQARGNSGPILEAPKGLFNVEANRLLLSGYHGRPTSACVNELPREAEEVGRLIDALPQRSAIAALRAMGFTTLVLHHGSQKPEHLRVESAVLEAAERVDSPLHRLQAIASMTAYELRDSTSATPSP